MRDLNKCHPFLRDDSPMDKADLLLLRVFFPCPCWWRSRTFCLSSFLCCPWVVSYLALSVANAISLFVHSTAHSIAFLRATLGWTDCSFPEKLVSETQEKMMWQLLKRRELSGHALSFMLWWCLEDSSPPPASLSFPEVINRVACLKEIESASLDVFWQRGSIAQ